MRFARIPEELKLLRQWVCWQAVSRDGKVTKVPYCAATGSRASITNRSDWCSFDEAVAALAKFPHFSGIGFCFDEEGPYVGIDLDKSANPQVWEYHSKIYNATRSYTERSPSGNGAHIIVRARMSGSGRRNTAMGVEVYGGARYFTVTGDVIDDRSEVEDGQALVDWLLREMGGGGGNAAIGETIASGPATDSDGDILNRIRAGGSAARFEALFNGAWAQRVGDPPGVGYGSQSDADLAIFNIIAQYTQNHEQIIRIFHASALGKRQKAYRADYLRQTLAASLDRHVPDEQRRHLEEVIVKPGIAKAQAHAEMQAKQAAGVVPPRRGAAPVEGEARAFTGPPVIIKKCSEYADDVAVEWLWFDHFARKKFHLLAGDPEAGKTTLMLSIAAILSNGGVWPDGSHAAPGNVLIWADEDEIDDTLKPRLKQMRADQDRVRFVEATLDPKTGEALDFDPSTDMPRLVEALDWWEQKDGWRPDMVWFDPIALVQSDKGDQNSGLSVRRALRPLINMAKTRSFAACGVHHFTKNTQSNSIGARVTGSGAWNARSRLGFVAVKNKRHEEDENEPPRYFGKHKSNVGTPATTCYAYNIVTGDVPVRDPYSERGRIEWMGVVDRSIEDAVKEAERPADEEALSERAADIKVWLSGKLPAVGAVSSADIFAAAKSEGVSIHALKRYSKDMIKKERTAEGTTMWSWKPEPKGKPRR